MTKPQENNKSIEDQLANYTDSILSANIFEQDEATFAPDPELRALQQTALQLKEAFGNDDPEEAVIQKIQRNVVNQWQHSNHKDKTTNWQTWIKKIRPTERKWQSQRSRQRFSIALSLATLAVLLLVAIPFLNVTDINQPGASGQNLNVYVLIALGVLILLAVWLFRRKP